jgi:hypothetical protein
MPFGLSTSDAIAIASLLVAAVSMICTVKSANSTSQRIDALEEKPTFWLDLTKLTEDVWRLTLNVRNRTKYSIRLDAISVKVDRVPVDKSQDFLLGDYHEISEVIENSPNQASEFVRGRDTSLKMSLDATVHPEETVAKHVLLFRGRASNAMTAKISVHYDILKESPTHRIEKVSAPLDGRKITILLKRV